MAIITASAKLYQGIRCYVVDKNISATLTATFTIGNQNQPSPILDGNGNIILQSGVKVFKIVRTIADLLCPRPKPTLINEKYKTYGGGNNVINADGSVDNTNNSKITATLTCQFPTYFRLDPKTLGLPEGQDCIIMLEEGFVYENQGTTATNKAAYPTLLSTPSPRNDSFVSFRTPKTLSKTLTNIVSTVYAFTGRIRPFASNISSAMAFTVKTTYQRAGAIILTGGAGFILPIAVKTARLSENLAAVSTIITNNRRVRPFDAAAYTITATLNHQSATARLRQGQADAPVASFITASGDRTLGPISASITSTATLGCDIGKIMGIIETTPVVSSLSFTPTKTTRIQQSLVATASLSGDGSVPMVLSTTTYYANEVVVLPIFYGNINAQVSWGDGTNNTYTQTPGAVWNQYPTNANVNAIKHTYATPGTYKITISGYVQHWGFANKANIDSLFTNTPSWANFLYNHDVISFGYIGIETLCGAYINSMLYRNYRFKGYINGVPQYSMPNAPNIPSRLPDTCKDTSWMFYQTSSDGGVLAPGGNVVWVNNNISAWNTSNVENMSGMFFRCRGGFNTNLGSWNVSKVTNFSNMFYFASNYTGQGLGSWNTASATNMSFMFYFSSFNTDLPNWNVSSVTDFRGMFAYTAFDGGTAFNGRLTYWDLSSAPNAAALELMLFGAGINTGGGTIRYTKDLTWWCVPNITSTPANFGSGIQYNLNLPYWSQCPGRRPEITSVVPDKTIAYEGETITFTVTFVPNANLTANLDVSWRINPDYPNWEFFNYGNIDSQTGDISPTDLNYNYPTYIGGANWSGTLTQVSGNVYQVTVLVNSDLPGYEAYWAEGDEYFRLDIISRQLFSTPWSQNDFIIGSSPVITIKDGARP